MLIDAVLIDDVTDIAGGTAIRYPDEEVVLTVRRRCVHKARTGIVGNVVTGEHGDVVLVEVGEFVQRVGQRPTFRVDIADALETGDFRAVHHGLCEGVGQNVLVAGRGERRKAELFLAHHGFDFIETVGDVRIEADRLVCRDRPRRCCPDDDRELFALNRELHPDHRDLAVMIFDFGFGEGGSLYR